MLAGLGLIAGGVWWTRSRPVTPAFRTARARVVHLAPTLAATGWWRSPTPVVLRALTLGTLHWQVTPKRGLAVPAGEPLFTVSTPAARWQAAAAQAAWQAAEREASVPAAVYNPAGSASAAAAYATWQARAAAVAPVCSPLAGRLVPLLPAGTTVAPGDPVADLWPQRDGAPSWQVFLPLSLATRVRVGDVVDQGGRPVGRIRFVDPAVSTEAGTAGHWAYGTAKRSSRSGPPGLPVVFTVLLGPTRTAVAVPDAAYRVERCRGGVEVYQHGRWRFQRVRRIGLGPAGWVSVAGLRAGTVVRAEGGT
ncbi:MAG: hypothetical protein OWV35_04855 [Firmicutes bacterium]|nr:hypothetical protein [Bacillota bacterium]